MYKVMSEMAQMFSHTEPLDLHKVINLLANGSFDKIVGIGAGRMGYSLRAFIMRMSHIGFETYFIGDTSLPRINKKTLVIINSSSGETPTNILYARQAKEAGSYILTFTCNKESTIGQLSDMVFNIPVIETTQLMKSVFEQYTYLIFDTIADEYVECKRLNISAITQNHSILE